MDEMKDQYRAILFVVLALAVLFAWSHFFKPPAPPPAPAQTQQQQRQSGPAPVAGPAALPGRPHERKKVEAKTIKIPAVAASQEKTIVVESPLYRVELSNRGGVVHSWKLKKYSDDETPPQPLDLVNADSAAQIGWPMSLLVGDAQGADKQYETQANAALYEVTPGPEHFDAPAEITFHWSDGHLDVTKKLKFDQSYEVSIEVTATLDGEPLPAAVAWRGGFGDKGIENGSQLVSVFYKESGKLTLLQYKKLGVPGNQAQPYWQSGPVEFTGLQDQFFTAVFLPDGGTPLSMWHWMQQHSYKNGEKDASEPEPEMAAGATEPGPLTMRAYVGPKDLALLSKVQPPLEELISFGWTSIIAKPLFYALKWIHKYVPNYGWAIVLLTLAINLPLFPLKMMTWRSMQKMQKVGPEVRSIQDRYKKYSMTDPRKKKMNEEVMAVYSREGINPAMSCLPMLAQAPIWWALWRVLTGAIELRHAPWIFWIHDLSAKDPYYIVPAAMAVTMYMMTKMTPTPTTDPAQQKMQSLMPLMFAVIFFRYASGLNLYMFTSNLVGVGQQLYLNKTDPLPSRSKFKKKNGSGK
ncbi:MAG: membrane protein insertase YidC [Candidatus Acidiferrales bacterium]